MGNSLQQAIYYSWPIGQIQSDIYDCLLNIRLILNLLLTEVNKFYSSGTCDQIGAVGNIRTYKRIYG